MTNRTYVADLRTHDFGLLAKVIADGRELERRQVGRAVEFWASGCTDAPILRFQERHDGTHVDYDSSFCDPSASLPKAGLVLPRPITYHASCALPPTGGRTWMRSGPGDSNQSLLSRMLGYFRR